MNQIWRMPQENDPSDSKIRNLLKGAVSLHSPPPNGRQLLIKKIRALENAPEKQSSWFQLIFEFFQLPNRDPESLVLSETFVLAKARVFGLPGSESLHLI